MDPFLLLIKVRFLEFSPNLLFLQEDTSWDIILHLIIMSISFNKKNPVSVYSCAYFYVRGMDVCMHAFLHVYVCACIHVHLCAHACIHVFMCIYVCLHMGQKMTLSVVFSELSHLVF